MSYISSLLQKSCDLINYTREATKASLGIVPGGVREKLLQGAVSIVHMSPWPLSKMKNMRIIGKTSLAGAALFQWLEPAKNWAGAAKSSFYTASHAIAFMDSTGFAPVSVKYRVAVDGLLLVTTLVGSYHAVTTEGPDQILSSLSDVNGLTAYNLSNLAIGCATTAIGATNIANCVYNAIKMTKGLLNFQKMEIEPEQKYFAVKNKAIYSLFEKKKYTAVIFDGDVGGPSFPFAEELYQRCNIITCVVKSSDEFSKSLEHARKQFGCPIDFISFQGHATNKKLLLNGEDYPFTANEQEINAMKEHLSPKCQIFYLGCNSATFDFNFSNLTKKTYEKLSSSLPNIQVCGATAFYNPMTTVTTFSEKDQTFKHDQYVGILMALNSESLYFINNPLESQISVYPKK